MLRYNLEKWAILYDLMPDFSIRGSIFCFSIKLAITTARLDGICFVQQSVQTKWTVLPVHLVHLICFYFHPEQFPTPFRVDQFDAERIDCMTTPSGAPEAN